MVSMNAQVLQNYWVSPRILMPRCKVYSCSALTYALTLPLDGAIFHIDVQIVLGTNLKFKCPKVQCFMPIRSDFN